LNLSESLCKDAKKLVKEKHPKRSNGIPESALAFYKVQESFTDKLSILRERTLRVNHEGKLLDYYFGPYLLNDIAKLNEKLKTLQEAADVQDGSKAIGKLRRIVSDSYKDFAVASFNLHRMKDINENLFKQLNLEDDLEIFSRLTDAKGENLKEKSQLLDLITLHGFRYGTRQN
jgi:hypothetical protein